MGSGPAAGSPTRVGLLGPEPANPTSVALGQLLPRWMTTSAVGAGVDRALAAAVRCCSSPSTTMAHIARNGLRPDETYFDGQPPAPRAPDRDLSSAALTPSKLSPPAGIATRQRPFSKRMCSRERSRV